MIHEETSRAGCGERGYVKRYVELREENVYERGKIYNYCMVDVMPRQE